MVCANAVRVRRQIASKSGRARFMGGFWSNIGRMAERVKVKNGHFIVDRRSGGE